MGGKYKSPMTGIKDKNGGMKFCLGRVMSALMTGWLLAGLVS
jgi:hypothetical protein